MTIDHEVLETVVQNDLGFDSIDEFARQQAFSLLAEKAADLQKRITAYEDKYGMDYETFRMRVIDKQDLTLKGFGIFEKEDDDFNWEDCLHALAYYKQRLHLLSA